MASYATIACGGAYAGNKPSRLRCAVQEDAVGARGNWITADASEQFDGESVAVRDHKDKSKTKSYGAN